MSTVISIENISKSYRLGLIGTGTLREDLQGWWHRVRGLPDPNLKVDQMHQAIEGQTLWALQDVSLEVKQGEVLGIIGRNGAGKSTLLKILSRVTAPTSGRIRVKGRVASLLEVGTGFHPELTGRENIFLNGAILGMTKAEVTRKFDEIVAFSEIEQFIDTPVKRYSSGMYVRLAFAVAAHLDPEILVVDEVLAVGDVAFQKKCLGRMSTVAGEGRTVLFVSHNMQAVRQLCTRAVWLKKGALVMNGLAGDVVNEYLLDNATADDAETVKKQLQSFSPDPACRVDDVNIRQNGRDTRDILSGESVDVQIAYEIFHEVHGFHITIELLDSEGTLIFDSLSNGEDEELPSACPGCYVSTCRIPADFLAAMKYELRIAVGIANIRTCTPRPISIPLHVVATGLVNRAYPGYRTPGKLAPLLPWTHVEAKGS